MSQDYVMDWTRKVNPVTNYQWFLGSAHTSNPYAPK